VINEIEIIGLSTEPLLPTSEAEKKDGEENEKSMEKAGPLAGQLMRLALLTFSL
jgi:hypothetical protein